ncbi:MAG: hypothetical protein JRL30_01875 [Deltaproteobacteria bacterium]|nr:hypothetical protein [Deltaproteobacteria bacterium]
MPKVILTAKACNVFRFCCPSDPVGSDTFLTAGFSFVNNIRMAQGVRRKAQGFIKYPLSNGVHALGKSKQKTKTDPAVRGKTSIQAYSGSIIEKLHTLPEKAILDRILEHPAPRQLIQRLPSEDFFWLMKKAGEDSFLQLLRLASIEQWQYLLDLELWQKDRMDMEEAALWLRRLQLADPGRLTGWLFTDGQALAYYYLFKNIEVEIRDPDEPYDFEEGFITLDGLFYVKVGDPEQKETIEGILRTMADADSLRYQSFLSGLAGVLPAELEEQMYRLRNVRLAEHGFLPPEEALLVYAPLEPDALTKPDVDADRTPGGVDEDVLRMAPHSPLSLIEGEGGNLLTKFLYGDSDSRFIDRVRLEFAGLCNQVLSADGLTINEMDILKTTCRKSAGYLNLILERMCGDDMGAAEGLLKKNPLISLFRAGFGLAQKLKWKAERWLKKSWFRQRDLGFDFWGDSWGYTLAGLVAKRPLYYRGPGEDGEYKDFEHDDELRAVSTVLDRLMGLDRILARLTEVHPLDLKDDRFLDLTFHPLLFTLWARQILDLAPSFEGISLEQARRFFQHLRSGDNTPPYHMPGFEGLFVKDFMKAAAGFGLDPQAAAILKDTLSLIWQGFCREYEQVPVDALDLRYSTYIVIKPSPRSPAR